MFKIRPKIPCREGRLILRIALPMILVCSIATLLGFLEARQVDATRAILHYVAYPEYILASLAVTFGGVFLTEQGQRPRRELPSLRA